MRRAARRGGVREGCGEKRGFKVALDAEVSAEVERLIGPEAADALDFEAVETAVRRHAFRVAAKVWQARLNADHGDHSAPTLPCTCGGVARYTGRREKTFTTALGEMTLSRAYYHCATCGHGWCPRDLSLGLAESSLSPAVTRMVGLVASAGSFEWSSKLLAELAGVEVVDRQVEREAEALGREIDADERAEVEPAAPEEVAPTLYVGLDGSGIPVRKEEVEGRAGKQPDGTAKTREAKTCVVWSAEGRDAKGRPVRDPGSATYSSAIESVATRDTDEVPAEFARRVLREALRRGVDHAVRVVVLGDGAVWIWNLADLYFPQAVQVLDLFHAIEHLAAVGRAVYGPAGDLAQVWIKARADDLKEGRFEAVLTELRAHSKAHEEAGECLRYFETNRRRMRYAEFRAQGLCVGSGVVEAACKTVVAARFKGAGMHWSVAGANAILALRCSLLSGRFEDFWERRAERLRAAAGR